MSIPVKDAERIAAERIAKDHGYDQIVILGRRVGDDGDETMTSYGRNETHCNVAALMARRLQSEMMKWPECDVVVPPVIAERDALAAEQQEIREMILEALSKDFADLGVGELVAMLCVDHSTLRQRADERHALAAENARLEQKVATLQFVAETAKPFAVPHPRFPESSRMELQTALAALAALPAEPEGGK